MNTSEEKHQLVNKTIRYLLVSDRRKQAISKARIIKHVLDSSGKHFPYVMNKAKNLLSKIFGYQLVELENNKYILVNEIENTLPHIRPNAIETRQRVLLFIVLVHIFMHQQSCTEDSLWDFLTNLDIPCSDNHCHAYFGNVKQLITEVFVAQKYLDKTVTEKNDSIEIDYKWGPRAEYEFSRRTALEFVSRVYHGRPVNSWPLQYNALTS
ncbi:non-structural maintenance of chromosomes element 3 homolog [Xylocopa sonorina]|uniref:non-structural maintenance of chromosomes element 3 homolog n=1 Tax=Xylocopa sonorina TaxID=1818115 RepID=UPI00403AD683